MSNNIMMPYPHEILDIKRETELEYTFRVAANGAEVRHGQFFQVSIPKVGEAPISVSDFDKDYLEFTIRKVGKLSNDIFGLEAGDNLFLRGPYGTSFPISEFNGKNLVVIAGGTGVSPVRSLLKHYHRNSGDIKALYLIAGFKNEKSILFREDLKAFAENPKFHTVYTLDNEKICGYETGFCLNHVDKIPFADFGDDYNIVIVGPPVMMGSTAVECIKNGAAEEKIWMSFERKMACAVGKCGHCKIDEKYVCLEGPVFNYTVAKKLVD